MAPDLVVCPNTTPREISEDRSESVYTDQVDYTTRMQSPNAANSCTTSSRSSSAGAAADPPPGSMFFRLVKPWSSHNNSPRVTTPPGENYSTVFLPAPTSKAKAPIITLKIREALRNLSCRDQESMEEEISQLKRALLEKEMELRRRKVQAANIEAENRKLAKDIETLEMNSNVGGPRTGSPRRLRSKIAGLKVMLEEAHNTCELQAIELYELRRDIRLTHARELEVERNVYATEVRRLQQLVKKLKLANGRIGHENRVVGRLKAKNHHLEVMNLRLSSCLSASLSQIPRNPRTPVTPRTPRTPRTPCRTPRTPALQHDAALFQHTFDGFDTLLAKWSFLTPDCKGWVAA
ncbi:hypothetical protein KC19_3G241300 [Ceratodon purpureus]|uniref:Uncharacterized protein n=1 Tax=Ceratodon purpureus TaxID=3225 RepID=A0A8T0INV6_CERPU|nr:hypothetical protein KC19_3G241300 [Ceratodon purpureus]